MGGFVWAVRSGLVWPPFDPGAAARYYDFMPYILHLPWKEEVLVDAPKRSVYQLSLWLSCHIPPRCRWSVPGPQYARTSPNRNSANFAFWGFSEVQLPRGSCFNRAIFCLRRCVAEVGRERGWLPPPRRHHLGGSPWQLPTDAACPPEESSPPCWRGRPSRAASTPQAAGVS